MVSPKFSLSVILQKILQVQSSTYIPNLATSLPHSYHYDPSKHQTLPGLLPSASCSLLLLLPALYRLYFTQQPELDYITLMLSTVLWHFIIFRIKCKNPDDLITDLTSPLFSPLLIPLYSLWLPCCCKKHAKHALALGALQLLPLPGPTLLKYHLRKSSLIYPFKSSFPRPPLPSLPFPSLSSSSCFIFLKFYLLFVFSIRM